MWKSTLLFLLCMVAEVVNAEYDYPSLLRSPCVSEDELYTLAVESCQVGFTLHSTGGAVAGSRYSLMAVNSDCYECAPQFALSANETSMCARLWTPFDWNFTLWDTVKQTQVVGADLQIALGERGSYNVSANFAGVTATFQTLEVETVVEPEYALAALWLWLFAIFLPIIILNFTGASAAKWLKRLLYKGSILVHGTDGAYVKYEAGVGKIEQDGQSTPIRSAHKGDSFWEALVSPLSMTDAEVWHDKPSIDGGRGPEASGNALNTPLISRGTASDGPVSATVRFRGAIDAPTPVPAKVGAKKPTVSSRVDCLDTFRGMCLGLMIFVNYGGGGYWFFDHAAWNGLTFADLLFPWFMWVMGCSMALSYRRLHTNEYRGSNADAYVQLAHRQQAQYEKMAAAREESGVPKINLGSVDDDDASPKKYAVSTVQEGSSKGWSEIHSVPGTPTKQTPTVSQDGRAAQLALLEAANSGPTDLPQLAPTNAEDPSKLWKRVCRRAAILFSLGLFLNNGFEVTGESGHWRIPGVLQYFGISTLVVAGTVIVCRKATASLLADYEARMLAAGRAKWSQPNKPPPCVLAAESSAKESWFDVSSSVMYCYYYEYLVMAAIFTVYVMICLTGSAPGCPVGYNGAGGRGNEGEDADCTGGIHRYIDMVLVGSKHIYNGPTCKSLYECQSYDPEGFLGSMTACTLSYFGLTTGRILLHFPGHTQRLQRWLGLGAFLCLLAGCLCGFSQNDGLIPVNKNLWSASFGLVTAGGGMIGLSATYVVVDMYGLWTGAPFTYLGLNSILIFCSHEVFQEYFPFSWDLSYPTHYSLMLMNVIGVSLWIAIARYCYSIKFFVKI
jgi:predicted acyltransferase